MDAILEQFLGEARDNLDYLDSHLKELDGGDEEAINALFRAAHTLKGGAGLVGLTHVKEITHAAEDLLDAYRNKKIAYSDEMLDTLYDAFDEVIELIDAVEESGNKDIEVDEEHIQNIKNSVRAFLSNTSDEEEELELPFRVDEEIELESLTNAQLEAILPHLDKEDYWIIDLNLSEETIEFGNDPFYLVSMLEEENILAIQTEVYNPDDITNPLSLKTRMKVVCKSDVENIEDIFYNIIDEIAVSPLSKKNLLLTQKESIQNDTFETLVKEIQEEGVEGLEQKLEAGKNVINPDTKEGFLVDRLLNISKIDATLVKGMLEELGIKQKTQVVEQNEKEGEYKPSLNEKEKETTLNILNAQKMALKSEGAFERVKFILKSVASFLGVQKSEIDNIEDTDALNDFISSMIASLGGSTKELNNKEAAPPSAKKEKHNIAQKTPTETKHVSVPKTVKIDQEEIDALMDIVGEILVVKNSLPYVAESMNENNVLSAKRELLSKYEEISRITDQLQDRVMGMRLLPISYIFNRYPKLVRDMSKKLNKKIEYVEYGGDTKLDKMMIEKLADPLIHIIRNSLDHGLETPQERIEAGKSEKGTLSIGARSEGDRVFIEIKDDGRGIDVDKVINIALQKRLIDPDTLDDMSESEKLGLIFLPGLSTKDEITDLSGRGVGADAVKTTVAELNGKIDIKSEKGKGTVIVLELPVSVALTNLFQIKMADENYAISMDSVIETDKIKKEDIQTANHNPFIRLRESIIPLVLNNVLLKRDEFKDEENIIIIKVAGTQIALVADELVGQIDVVQKPLTGVLQNHPFINGTSLLGNGKPLFIIKPEALFEVL
jgi:two-component system chemotaxis sensor kinase CheA